MTDHLPVFERIEEDALRAAARVRGLFEPHHRAADAAPETPAMMPVNLAAQPAATKEDTVSLATFEQDLAERAAAFEATVRNEIGKLTADVPAITAEAKALAATPLGQLAVTAAGHLAAGVIPPEALAIVESEAASIYGKILSLYQPAAPAQPAAP